MSQPGLHQTSAFTPAVLPAGKWPASCLCHTFALGPPSSENPTSASKFSQNFLRILDFSNVKWTDALEILQTSDFQIQRSF